MICHPTNFKVVASILLATFFSFFSYSQEAEKLFHKQYSKLSIVLQPSKLEKSYSGNNDMTRYPSIDMKESFSYQFGVYYNFAQKGKFNFKTGLIAKRFYPKFSVNISKEDIGYGSTGRLPDFPINNAFIFSVPFKTEYIQPITPKFNFVAGFGISLEIFTGGNEDLSTGISVYNDVNEKQIFGSVTTQEQRGFARELSVGCNYKSKMALFQLELFHSQNLSHPIVSGYYKISNLENSPNKGGSITVYNNFYGLSLSISPQKKWLIRKSKK